MSPLPSSSSSDQVLSPDPEPDIIELEPNCEAVSKGGGDRTGRDFIAWRVLGLKGRFVDGATPLSRSHCSAGTPSPMLRTDPVSEPSSDPDVL